MRKGDYIVLRPKTLLQRIFWFLFVPAYKFEDFLAEDELHIFFNKVRSFTKFFNCIFLIYKTDNYETIILSKDADSINELSQINFKKYFLETSKKENFLEKIILTLFLFSFLFAVTFGSVKYVFTYMVLSKLYKAIVIFVASFLNLTLPLFLMDNMGSKIHNFLIKNIYYLLGTIFLIVDMLSIYFLF